MADKAIFFSTAGKWQVPAILEAKNLGYKIIAVDSNPDAIGLKLANFPLITELSDTKSIFDFIDALPVRVVASISYCSEIGLTLAAKVREKLNLGYPNEMELEKFINKKKQRQLIDSVGMPNPKWISIKNVNDSQIRQFCGNFEHPLIVKPLNSSGSRGVSHVENFSQLSGAIYEAQKNTNLNEILIEEFKFGTEYTVDFMVNNSILTIFVITEKAKSKITTKTVSSILRTLNPMSETGKKLQVFVEKITNIFSIKTGIFHLEAIVHNDYIFLVEIAIRGGGFGLSKYLIPEASGINHALLSIQIESRTLDGNPKINYKPSILYFEPSKAGILKSISGITETNNINGVICEQLIASGSEMKFANSDGDRVLLIMISADSENELEDKFLRVKKLIKIEII
ncbi:MAG: hypothetical protein RLZZ44_1769 [Bacteroidota bacterium]